MKKIFLILLSFCFTAAHALAQTVTITVTQQPCFYDGILTATTTGFTPPLTFNWSGQRHTNIMTPTDVLTGYSGQHKYLSVTDNFGRNVFTDISLPVFSYTIDITNATCPQLGTATLVNLVGGTPPYTAHFTENNTGVQYTGNSVSLPRGYYASKVTDAHGCLGSDTTHNRDSFDIYESNPFVINTNEVLPNCTNGSITVTSVTNGTPPYSYQWSNGATTAAITGLMPDAYYLTVTDAIGCSGGIRNIYLSAARSVTLHNTSTQPTCSNNNGGITLLPSLGVAPYIYNWSDGVHTQNRTNLVAGNYFVTVVDADGCVGEGSFYLNSSTPIIVNYTNTPSSCLVNNGTITLSLRGGTAPYQVSWSNGATGTALTGLAADTYSFTVIDAAGCRRMGTIVVPPINIIQQNSVETNPYCATATGSIRLAASNGTAPYTYSWNTGATTSAITGLVSGHYAVTITDAVGCHVNKRFSLAVASPLTISLSTTPASCIFAQDGTADAHVFYGRPPYTYSWAGGINHLGNQRTGGINLYVSDMDGCTASKYATIGYDAANTSCYCTIQGTAYNDANNNCMKDANEQGIANLAINCATIGTVFTDAQGNYSFIVPTGSYAITETQHPYYPLATCQVATQTTTVTASAGCVSNIDFANTILTIHDMKINSWSETPPRPGFNYRQRTVIENIGTVDEANAWASMTTDGQIGVPLFTPLGIFSTYAPNNYNNNNNNNGLAIAKNEGREIFRNYQVPVTVPLSTSLVFKDTTAYTSSASNWLNDESPWNNVNYYSPITVGSYDPNFKEVNPRGMGADGVITRSDSVLNYAVHFENIGRYFAENIVVIDTLDSNFDFKTFRPIYKSHKCNVTLSPTGVLKYEFKRIYLPGKDPQYPESASQGMFSYTIKPKQNLPTGTTFKNKADIYFDFNKPISTNKTINTLDSVKTINHDTIIIINKITTMKVYPNPARDVINVEIASNSVPSELRIINLIGQTIYTQTIPESKNGTKIKCIINDFPVGVYIITVASKSDVETKKFFKMK